MDRDCWTIVYGAAKSQTRLKSLSSSSNKIQGKVPRQCWSEDHTLRAAGLSATHNEPRNNFLAGQNGITVLVLVI